MATVRQQLDTRNQTLRELWKDHFENINDQSSVYSSDDIYDESESIYTTESGGYLGISTGSSIRPTVRRRGGISQSRVTEMNKVLRLNQSGVGKNVGDQKTIQLFNSNATYKKNEHSGRRVRRSVYDPITQEQDHVRTLIRYMIDHWDRIAQVSVQEGAPIGISTNLPGSNHTQRSAAGVSTPNRFRFGAGYKRLFLTSVDNPAERASDQELNILAKRRFNEAQVLGGKSWGTGEKNDGIGRFNLNSPAAFIGSALDVITGGASKERLDRQREKLENIRQDIVSAYLPGFNRITQPFHARSSLDDYLQQNILLPPSVPRTSGNPTVKIGRTWDPRTYSQVPRIRTVVQEENTSTFATYRNTYINNPVRPPPASVRDLADPQRFDKGVISGVAIKDLERQGEGGANVVGTARSQPPEIFSHTEDETRMSNDMKHRGFTQNIAGTIRGGSAGGLSPAVENIGLDDYGTSVVDKMGSHEQLGDLQYFPFLFTTENRTGAYQQACYLQATISNLNESYQPNWSPKHFFGRTEQVHTYTYTDRSIDLSFMIYADDMRRLQNVWERVSWLAQQTYGQYDMNGDQPQSRLLNGPILRMTVGDLYRGLPGFIRSLSIDWNALSQGGKWEMTQGIRMPMACNVQMSYAVIHDDNPYRDYNLYPGLVSGGNSMLNISGNRRLIPGNNDDRFNRLTGNLDLGGQVDIVDAQGQVRGSRTLDPGGGDPESTYVDLVRVNTSV